jgi:hypothetical protein
MLNTKDLCKNCSGEDAQIKPIPDTSMTAKNIIREIMDPKNGGIITQRFAIQRCKLKFDIGFALLVEPTYRVK